MALRTLRDGREKKINLAQKKKTFRTYNVLHNTCTECSIYIFYNRKKAKCWKKNTDKDNWIQNRTTNDTITAGMQHQTTELAPQSRDVFSRRKSQMLSSCQEVLPIIGIPSQ
jgi:hypothetical protein